MKQKIIFTLLGILIFNIGFGQEKKTLESNLNQELVALLDSIHQEDQKYREESQKLEKKYGLNSKEMQDIWKVIDIKDSTNLVAVEKILDEKGWLGADIVGETGNTTLFLVIQHADTGTQIKYLPMLREAVKKGNAKASYLALMEDRVLIAQGEKQIYGSQLEMDFTTREYVLSPMIDPDNVDTRRAEVGLKTISEYLQYWNLTWDVEKFKKRMIEYDLEKNRK
jgi:hypothetical protein